MSRAVVTISSAPPVDKDGQPILFLERDEVAKALRVGKATLTRLLAQRRDPAAARLLRGKSRLGRKHRFHWRAVEEAGELLAGRDWPSRRRYEREAVAS